MRPLADRRVRWWPNPYGWGARSAYADRAANTAPAARRAARDAEEHVRLLYVGFTRARDRLILAIDATDPPASNTCLRALCDAAGEPILAFPGGGDPDAVRVGGTHAFPCRLRTVRPTRPTRTHAAPAGVDRLAFDDVACRAPAEIVLPSAVELPEPSGVTLGPAFVVTGGIALPDHIDRMDDVGNAIHAFLAADDALGDERIDRATRAIAAFGVTSALRPADLVRCGDGLRAWVAAHVGPAEWLREWPVRWALADGRLMIGEIDLVLDVGDGLVVIDHKSFPGDPDERDRRAVHHAGQLAAYGAVAEAALGKPVKRLFLHFPVRGEMQEVYVPADAFARWLDATPAADPPAPDQLDLFGL